MKNRLAFSFLCAFFLLLATMFSQTHPYQDATIPIDQRVNDLLARMSLDEKIGQMMQVDLTAVDTNRSVVTSYYIGSVLSGGDSDPVKGNTADYWTDVYDAMQKYALKTRLKIPVIYGVDAVHGHNNVYGATIFPHNIGMGCTRDPQLVEAAARATAIEVAATGIDWTFGPCIAVPRDERWGRTYEGFGETPDLAELLGAAAVRGFQGDTLAGRSSILACAKHFLGDGGTTGGVDQGNTESNEADIRNIHLPGYFSAINANVGSIMASFSSINGIKMHGSKFWINDVLKDELGFKGFVVSDWAALDQLNNNYELCVEMAINAGIDMVMLPFRHKDFRDAMLTLIDKKKISIERIDDAVRRILTAKFELGLFERPFADRTMLPLVGCADHRALARKCVRESIVLLKKKDGIVPLRKTNSRILVAGSSADDIGNQCGGWTIRWQGQSGNVTVGTTILQGMNKVAPAAKIEFSKAGDFTNTKADYSVVVIGETPYAEGDGDRKDLGISKTDVEVIKKVKSYGAPVIVILVSGRPLILDEILHHADVVFAAWLPGTEGEGVADVLFGDYQPHGCLSHTWPKSMAQIPTNIGDSNYHPLYEYGYGIASFEDSPKGSSPVIQSAIVTDDAQCIELTFNKPMAKPSSPAAFTLTKSNIPFTLKADLSLKEDDNTTLIIKLDSAYYSQGDSATISFTAGTIESEDNGVLQPFGPLEICNCIGR